MPSLLPALNLASIHSHQCRVNSSEGSKQRSSRRAGKGEQSNLNKARCLPLPLGSMQLRQRRLCSALSSAQPAAAPEQAPPQHAPPILARHSLQEAVPPLANDEGWLVRALGVRKPRHGPGAACGGCRTAGGQEGEREGEGGGERAVGFAGGGMRSLVPTHPTGTVQPGLNP